MNFPSMVFASGLVLTACSVCCSQSDVNRAQLLHEATASGDLDGTLSPLKLNFGAMDDASAPAPTSKRLRIEFTTWIWIMGLEGDVAVRGNAADVSASFGDLLDSSDSIFALSGRIEGMFGDWGGFIDGMYSNLGVDDATGPLGIANIDVTFEEILIDFGVMYRIGEWAPGGSAAQSRHSIALDLYGGARYTCLDLELAPAMAPVVSGDIDWIDPIIGAKLTLPLAEDWLLKINGDIGGFGVGSDFTWSATAVIGYDFNLFDIPSTVYLGYRAIGQDYSEGSGATLFVWDVVQHGVILGFGMSF